MKKNKDNIFSKLWIACLVFIVALSVCGMLPQVKNTYAAPTLYGMYRWPVSDTKDSSGTMWLPLQVANYTLMADSKENEDVVFNVNFKSGGYTPTDIYELENYALNINDSNMSSFNKIKVNYWKNNMKNCGYYPSGMYGCSGSENVSDIYYGNSTYLNLFTNVSGSSSSPSFHSWNYYKGVQTNYLTLDFGTAGSTVTGEEYSCPSLINWGKKCNYDAEKFVEYFEKAAIKINACYYEEDEQDFSWGHGSNHIGATLFPEFDTQELCDSMKVVELTTDYGNLSCNTSSKYKCIKESNQKLIFFLPSSTGDGKNYNITKLYNITNVPNNIVMSDNIDVSYTDVNNRTINKIVDDNNIWIEYHQYNHKIKTMVNANPKVTFMVEGKVYAKKTIKYGEQLSTILPKNPSAPGNTGYEFIGWMLGDKQIKGYDRITSDLVLTAKFATAYKVDFYWDKVEPGQKMKTVFKHETVERGGILDIPSPSEPSYPRCRKKENNNWVYYDDDYYVAGWKDSATDKVFDFTKGVTGSYELYPYCELKLSVYFVFSLDNLKYEVQRVAKGSLASEPDKSTMENKDNFIGWSLNVPDSGEKFERYDFNTPITDSSVYLYAWFRKPIPKYTVTFYNDIGSIQPIESWTVEDGTLLGNVVLFTPKKDGYSFKNWVMANGSPYDPNMEVRSDVKLYASWLKEYTIKFDSDGGTAVSQQKILEGSTVVKPKNPTKKGFEFVRWVVSTNNAEYDFSTKVTSNIILKAVWAPVTVPGDKKNIVYYGNADGVTNVPSSVSFEESTKISLIYPSRNNFSFTGWNTKSNCSGRYFARGATVYKRDIPNGGTLNLYACWAPVTDQCSFKNTTK